MSMNTNDPNQMPQQVPQPQQPVVPVQPQMPQQVPQPQQPVVPVQPQMPQQPIVQPIAQPQTPVAPVAPVQQPAPVSPIQQAPVVPPQTPKEKKSKKPIIIITILAVLIIGLGTVVALILSGAFGEEKETKKPTKTKKPKTEATTEDPTDDPTDDPSSDPTDDPTSDTTEPTSDTSDTSESSSDTSATANPNLAHEQIDSVDKLPDSLLQIMQIRAEEFFNTSEGTQLPNRVTVKEFNYLGMVITDEFWEMDDYGEYIAYDVNLVYQIQVTDNTSGKATDRQFFWYVQFEDMYMDDTDPIAHYGSYRFVVYDNWSVQCNQSFESVKLELEGVGGWIDDNLDKDLILPLNGKAYTTDKLEMITKESQLSDAQLRKMQEYTESQFRTYDMPDDKNVHLDRMEYLGSFIAQNEYGTDLVSMVYEISVVYSNNGTTESRKYYWYRGFFNPLVGDEITLYPNLVPLDSIEFDNFSVNGYATVEEATKDIQAWHYDMYVEDNIDYSLVTLPGFIFPNSDTEEISDSAIKALSDEDLRMAINEIWARHGYIFRNKDILDYYRQFDWYEEKIPADEWDSHGQDYYLNSIEKKNIEKMTKERESRG